MIAILLRALCCWCLWLFEIWLRGWNDLGWLHELNGSALPICAVIATSACFAIATRQEGLRPRLLFVAINGPLCFVTYLAARSSFRELFSGFYSPANIWLTSAPALAAGSLLALIVTLSARLLLAPVAWWSALLVALAQPLSVLLALLTIIAIPAYHGSQDEVHAFKMGYPVFWVALLLPLALRLGATAMPGIVAVSENGGGGTVPPVRRHRDPMK